MVKLLYTFVFLTSLCLAGPVGSLAAADASVAISVHADVESGTLRVRGTATVPDGAWIMYAAYRAAAPQTRATGYTQVDDEEFAAQLDVSSWPTGELAVDVHFQMLLPGRRQPDPVVARFGPNGERMIGENVIEGGMDFRAAIASTRATKLAD